MYAKARHVQATWTRHCNKALFASGHKDDTFPTIDINVPEGRRHFTMKTMKTFDYVYKHHYNDADWFMKAHEDTYVILENLRYLLSSQNTSQPVYFGHILPFHERQGHIAGGAGYVLSREALRRLVNRKKGLCREDLGDEDIEIGRCLEMLGVKIVDSRDSMKHDRFYPQPLLLRHFLEEGRKYGRNGAMEAVRNISEYAISFHHLQPHYMYVLEYFLYHHKTYGTTADGNA
ncbi:Glycoprotein-N-acetylgalactosamine 3-beta-galactosyltransferase 1 [Lamellibrachia satsuma]|nr:Glycoprotein-N-acetylgalactosamine 3-beta-galactosyltransferase 1 [Lamellibrachia satsuma]